MLIYLDSNIVIYLIEQPAGLGPLAAARITALRDEGHRMAVSPLVRMECLVQPLASADFLAVRDYTDFLASAAVALLELSPDVCDPAAAIRARHGFRPLDALHLAAAVEGGCGLFLTNDARLAGFPDIVVEVLA